MGVALVMGTNEEIQQLRLLYKTWNLPPFSTRTLREAFFIVINELGHCCFWL